MWITMKTTKLRNLCLSILVIAFVINAMAISLVHAAQTIPGVERLEKGIADYENGKYEEAGTKLEMALDQISNEDNESLWKTHFYLGLSYCLTGNNDEARKQFSAAQKIIKNKSPDEHKYSPKIVKLFKKALKPGQDDEWNDSITGMAFVFVKGGCFEMGDTFGDGSKNEKPVHEVCIDDFYLGKYEVTQGQWEDVMGSNPSKFKSGDNYPVERVSWDDVQEFIKKLNNKTGKKYRLPTEAEWEYAARSGGKREKYAGTSSNSELGSYAWYDNNSKSKTHSVGQKEPNGLGFYDMTGNVWEWSQDIYSKKAYKEHQGNNPIYTKNRPHRVLRGGSWRSKPGGLRACNRSGIHHTCRWDYLGLRLAGTVD
jgi:formylglycine-generating enzyme